MYIQPTSTTPPPPVKPPVSVARTLAQILDGIVVATILYGLYVTYFRAPHTCASIYDLEAVGTPSDPSPAAWVTLKFRRYPEGLGRRDVHVYIESAALERTLGFDWDYIASHAQKMAPNGMNRIPAPLPPGSDPPLGVPIELLIPLPLKSRIEHVRREDVWIRGELVWGGVRQGRVSEPASKLYIWHNETP